MPGEFVIPLHHPLHFFSLPNPYLILGSLHTLSLALECFEPAFPKNLVSVLSAPIPSLPTILQEKASVDAYC
jgi:hypothetical protein